MPSNAAWFHRCSKAGVPQNEWFVKTEMDLGGHPHVWKLSNFCKEGWNTSSMFLGCSVRIGAWDVWTLIFWSSLSQRVWIFFPPNRCWILVLLSSSPACICSVLRQVVPNLSLPNFTLWNSSLANVSLPTSIKLELTRLISAKPNYINPISTTQDKLGMAQPLVLLWCVHSRRRTMKVFSVKSVYVKLISIEPFSIISSFANCKRLIVFKPIYIGDSFYSGLLPLLDTVGRLRMASFPVLPLECTNA